MLNRKPERHPWNEERLRTHVLMPFLDALGLSSASILVEWRFSVRLGRNQRCIDGRPMHGSADALIKNPSGDNLFVVELKSPDKSLQHADIEQGISYARLLDRIAPFVVVSNGNDTQIYDTITKDRLDGKTFPTESRFFGSGCRLASGDDIRIRFEAIEHFIGFSPENVAAFSSGQIEVGIRSLRERLDGHGKYLPDVYVSRERVRLAFKEFLIHDAPVFALVGESGVGKTNEMCGLAESFAATHIVLFFAGHSLNQAPENVLADEFNWSFSQTMDTPKILRQLARIAERATKPVLIFVDAIDESPMAGFPSSMSDFARHLAPFAPAIRLVVSAKLTEWSRFETLHGNVSHLALGLSCTDANSIPNEATWRPGEHIVLDQFTECERDAALARYQRSFDLAPVTDPESRRLFRHPFLLRTFSETYQGQREVPTALTSDVLTRNWLIKKFAFSDDPEELWSRVVRIAKRIFQNMRDSRSLSGHFTSLETINVEKLHGIVIRDLVAHGILVRSVDENNRSAVRFFYHQVLYFLISRHVLCIDKLNASEYRKQVDLLLENDALQEVLFWHIQLELEHETNGRAFDLIRTDPVTGELLVLDLATLGKSFGAARSTPRSETPLKPDAIGAGGISRIDPPLSSHDRRLVEQLEDWLQAHFSETEARIESMAEAVAMDPRTLQRKLKALTGRTPGGLIRDYRIRQASRLLRETDRQLTEVAQSCGFSSTPYFNRVFQKAMGQTPEAFREGG